MILNLLERKKTVNSWLKEFEFQESDADVDLFFGVTQDKMINEQLSSKFYTKYHDFNIALDIEKKSLESYIGLIRIPQLPTAPIWPKKRLFASLGLILGLVISFIVVFINEVLLPSKDERLALEAQELETIVLGTLPRLAPATTSNNQVDQRDSVRV